MIISMHLLGTSGLPKDARMSIWRPRISQQGFFVQELGMCLMNYHLVETLFSLAVHLVTVPQVPWWESISPEQLLLPSFPIGLEYTSSCLEGFNFPVIVVSCILLHQWKEYTGDMKEFGKMTAHGLALGQRWISSSLIQLYKILIVLVLECSHCRLF